METMCPPVQHHNSFVATHSLGHIMYVYINIYINIYILYLYIHIYIYEDIEIHTYIYIYIYIFTYIHIHTYTHIHNILLLIYISNFVCRNRTIFYFFNCFYKSFLNDLCCDHAKKIICTCWTQIGGIFP